MRPPELAARLEVGARVTHRSLSQVRELGVDDALDGEDVIPGFRCALRDMLS